MRKYLILFCAIALSSCANDDDGAVTEEEKILGSWVLVEATSSIEEQFCEEKESTISFNANQSAQATFYLKSEECEPESSTGTWENNGNSAYTMNVPVIGDLTGVVNFSNDNRFTFTTVVGVLTFERTK